MYVYIGMPKKKIPWNYLDLDLLSTSSILIAVLDPMVSIPMAKIFTKEKIEIIRIFIFTK